MKNMNMTKRLFSLFMIFVVLTIIPMKNRLFAESQGENLPEVVKKYVDIVNQNNYGDLFKISSKENKQIYHSIYKNDNNINEHVGISNVSKMEIIDYINLEDASEILLEGYSDVDNNLLDYCMVKTSLNIFDSEAGPFKEGINYLLFAIKNESSGKKVHDVVYLDESIGEQYFPCFSLYSADGPVAPDSGQLWTTPGTIRVYLNDTGQTKTVSFKEYCYVVTANEAYSTYNLNAIKAIALAVKNFAWRRMLTPRFYADKNFDIKSTDQCYDVAKAENNKAITTSITSSVDFIWDYVITDSSHKLMVGFHRQNVNAHANARQNGGILSQEGAQELAQKGYTWQQILHYYYDRKANDTTYYNTEVASGNIIVMNLKHSLVVNSIRYDSYYHWSVCNECTYYHYKTPHSMVQVAGGGYGCTGCRYTSSNK